MANYALEPEHLYLEGLWLDLGKETICKDWALLQQELHNGASPATYLYRTCCLESFYQWQLLGEHPRTANKKLYTTAMLDNSCNIKIEMSRTSQKRKRGWVFSQMYNTFKEITDAAKTKPFHNQFLNQLAWDPKVEAMIRHQGKGSAATRKQLKQSYINSKSRLSQNVKDGMKMSYGVREEHRITLAFFQRMVESLSEADEEQLPEVSQASLPYFELSTDSYLTFLTYNANKFLLAFEWIFTLNQDGVISYEHCKVLAMLLQCLKCCYDNALLSQEDGLWKDTWQMRRRQPTVTHGMGMEKTIHESGYGWFLPKIDWPTMTFQAHLADKIRYSNTALRDTYRKRWAAVKDVKNDLERLEAIGNWLSLYQGNEQILYFLLPIIEHLIVRHFRKEVFRSLKKEIHANFQEDALAGDVMLCAHSLQKVLKTAPAEPDEVWSPAGRPVGLHIIASNRCKIRTVKELVDFLWDFNDGHLRKQWEHRGYRSLHQRALEIVRIHCGGAVADELHMRIKRTFVLTTWVVPYPNEQQFFQKSHGARLWLSIYHRKLACSVPRGTTISLDDLEKEEADRWVHSEDWRPHGPSANEPKVLNFMYRWGLWADNKGQTMQSIPSPSHHWAHENDSSMAEIGEELESIWGEGEG
jgi:hypothetical protein